MNEIALLFGGLIGLWLGTDQVVKNAVDIARFYHLSELFIGLTILSIGTDLPELVISVNGAIQRLQGIETSGVIIGNAIGSSFTQISIVMGIAGLLGTLQLSRERIKQDGFVMIGSVILLILTGLDGKISRIEGFSLIAIYLVYYINLFRKERASKKIVKEINGKMAYNLVYLTAGLMLVIFSSNLVVENATFLAEKWGVKQSFIGIIIIGLGTSLPELAISIKAIMNKSIGLSVGNLIGSNIFDTLIPIGLGGAISGLNIAPSIVWFDLPALLLLSGMVIFFFTHRRGLQKIEAMLLILLYLIYGSLKMLGI
jgi:cation:H+ antiporter